MAVLLILAVCTLFLAKFMLLTSMYWNKSCEGISGKTQTLYAIVFAARLVEITSDQYVSTLNTTYTRILFIIITYCLMLTTCFVFNKSYESQYDTLRMELLLIPCVILSFLTNYGNEMSCMLWTFSVYLESVVILPQISMIHQKKQVTGSVYFYISILFIYKLLHLSDCLVRFFGDEPYDRLAMAAAMVQLIFYVDFFLKGPAPLLPEEEKKKVDAEAAIVGADKTDKTENTEKTEHLKDIKDSHNNLKDFTLTPGLLKDELKITCEKSVEDKGKDAQAN